jgi:hypothetical protein
VSFWRAVGAGVIAVAVAASGCTAILGVSELVGVDAGGRDGADDHITSRGDASTKADGTTDHASPPACGSTNCTGCCDSSGKCVASPASEMLCGFGGNSCATCSSDAPCTNGICFGCSPPTVILGSDLGDTSLESFPSALAAGATTVLVGASGTEEGAGSAYIYVKSGTSWTFSTPLMPTIPTTTPATVLTNFGATAAMSGSTAMVGGQLNDESAVFVFNEVGTNWFNGQVIMAPVSDAGYGPPPALAMDGTTAIVGDSYAATVYVSSGSKWTVQARLVPGESGPDLYAGIAVAISGDTALVGVSSTTTDGNTARWADVFFRSGTTWTQQGSLAPAGLEANNAPHFNFSIAISGDTAILAANAGAWVYVRSGTSWTQAPLSGDAGLNDAAVNLAASPSDNAFGSALATTPGGLLAGDGFGYSGGRAFLFGLSSAGWRQYDLATFDAGPGGPLNYGQSVARSGTVAVVGAPGVTTFVSEGAALIYNCSP